MMDSETEKYMRRALQLASNASYRVAPNPMVGAVIVCCGKIIGEGFHGRYGEGHAEVQAIRSVKEVNLPLLKQSTLYVTLEPCSHYGKTPPCAQLIIEKQIPKVVIGCLDPFPKVSGRGVTMLKDAGVDVSVGVLEKECQALNQRFILFHSLHRPYIILKWAQSKDGYIDRHRNSMKDPAVVISTPFTQSIVHKLRSEVAAVLVGTHTALLDNPSLTVRDWYGKNPLRVVLDRTLRIPSSYHLLDRSVPTWIVTEKNVPSLENLQYVQMNFDEQLLPCLVEKLYQSGIQSLLVEGGALLHTSFLQLGLWDEIRIEIGNQMLLDGVTSSNLVSNSYIDSFSYVDGHLLIVHKQN